MHKYIANVCDDITTETLGFATYQLKLILTPLCSFIKL